MGIHGIGTLMAKRQPTTRKSSSGSLLSRSHETSEFIAAGPDSDSFLANFGVPNISALKT
jgi:hypothetical protein